ncbi:hypothetical protein ABT154_04475 [Streptomyces sp. NPDC001728]|uniref:hypothetical protein n=1 Tax=Streptomyces sp. NPDC001728 TaxID=3154396 RepID=UPI00332F84A2
MDLTAEGLNNRRIAATCFIAGKMVKRRNGRVFAELPTPVRAEAIASWLGLGPTR